MMNPCAAQKYFLPHQWRVGRKRRRHQAVPALRAQAKNSKAAVAALKDYALYRPF